MSKFLDIFKQTNNEFVEFIHLVINETSNPLMKPFALITAIIFGLLTYPGMYYINFIGQNKDDK